MAFRTLKLLLALLVLINLAVSPAIACFGPKLFVGAGQDPLDEVLYALVTLYVEEKTGVASTRVMVDRGDNPLDLLTHDKADLVLAGEAAQPGNTILQVDGLPLVVTGKRPAEELQFTTVLPAIRKLARLLERPAVVALAERVAAGESAMAVVRQFLMERRWI